MGSPARGIARNFSGWSKFVRNVLNQGGDSHKSYAKNLNALQHCLKQSTQTTIGIEGHEHKNSSNGVKSEGIAGLGGHGSDLTQIAWNAICVAHLPRPKRGQFAADMNVVTIR